MSAESNLPKIKSESGAIEKYNEENPFTDPAIAEQWAQSVEGEQGLWRDQTLYPALQSWLQSFSPNATIVDIGSGQGRVATELHGYGKYIGVEPSAFLTKRAEELYASPERDFIIGNAYNLPLPDNFADGALSINVWFHLADTDKAATELARVLKTGGTFFISTADNDSLEIWKTMYINPQIDKQKMRGEVRVPIVHMSMNTFYFQPNDSVVEMLQKHGLIVRKITKSLEIEGHSLFILIEGVKN